jgi:hypothetical protein
MDSSRRELPSRVIARRAASLFMPIYGKTLISTAA